MWPIFNTILHKRSGQYIQIYSQFDIDQGYIHFVYSLKLPSEPCKRLKKIPNESMICRSRLNRVGFEFSGIFRYYGSIRYFVSSAVCRQRLAIPRLICSILLL